MSGNQLSFFSVGKENNIFDCEWWENNGIHMSDPENPVSKVKDWVEKQGYSLEMRVAKIFKEAGFNVSQFDYYQDFETNKLREIDVSASVKKQIEGIDLRIILFIECKYLKKPWVVFTNPRSLNQYYYFVRILQSKFNLYEWKLQSNLQGRLLARLLYSMGRENMKKLSCFSIPKNSGYRITESFRADLNAKDNAFIATMQVSKSIEAHDTQDDFIYQKTIEGYEKQLYDSSVGNRGLKLYCSIAIPIIVVKGKLYECYLGSNNEVEVLETNSSVVLLSPRKLDESLLDKPIPNVIKILTEEAVEPYAKDIFKAINQILSHENAIIELIDYESSNLNKTSRPGEIPF